MKPTYQETLDFLFGQLPMYQRVGQAAYKNNLDTTLALDRYFKKPHRKFRSIHVAGTNGKGSVAHMLAAVLQKSGYRVGLYTSPHLKDFRERIKINGQEIEEQAVVDFVENHNSILKELKPSFFEMTVAMAFDYFARNMIDVAVVEVGMGGRLDSTNIIHPDLSIITNIGLDHTRFLGDSLEKIAVEKAGIIKDNVDLIVGECHPITCRIFSEKCRQKNAEVEYADQVFHVPYVTQMQDGKMRFNVQKEEEIVFRDMKIDLLGKYQVKNCITVLVALEALMMKGYKLSEACIYEGLEQVASLTGFKGRWQILDHNPLVVCDTAHNAEGLRLVMEQITQTAYKHLHIVFGVVDDKNIDQILEIMPKKGTYYFAKASIPRALDAKVLQKQAGSFQLKGATFDDVSSAYQQAKANARPEDLIFIGGSTFVVADVL